MVGRDSASLIYKKGGHCCVRSRSHTVSSGTARGSGDTSCIYADVFAIQSDRTTTART